MARITHVKSAQARYATKQVLNEDGTPKRTLITNRMKKLARGRSRG